MAAALRTVHQTKNVTLTWLHLQCMGFIFHLQLNQRKEWLICLSQSVQYSIKRKRHNHASTYSAWR